MLTEITSTKKNTWKNHRRTFRPKKQTRPSPVKLDQKMVTQPPHRRLLFAILNMKIAIRNMKNTSISPVHGSKNTCRSCEMPVGPLRKSTKPGVPGGLMVPGEWLTCQLGSIKMSQFQYIRTVVLSFLRFQERMVAKLLKAHTLSNQPERSEKLILRSCLNSTDQLCQLGWIGWRLPCFLPILPTCHQNFYFIVARFWRSPDPLKVPTSERTQKLLPGQGPVKVQYTDTAWQSVSRIDLDHVPP